MYNIAPLKGDPTVMGRFNPGRTSLKDPPPQIMRSSHLTAASIFKYNEYSKTDDRSTYFGLIYQGRRQLDAFLLVSVCNVCGASRSRSRDISKLRDMSLEFSDLSAIWQAFRQQCYGGACQISKQYGNFKTHSHSFEASRDLPYLYRLVKEAFAGWPNEACYFGNQGSYPR